MNIQPRYDDDTRLCDDIIAKIENDPQCIKELYCYQRNFHRGLFSYKDVEHEIALYFRPLIFGYVRFLTHVNDYDLNVETSEISSDVVEALTQFCLVKKYQYREPGPTEVCE